MRRARSPRGRGLRQPPRPGAAPARPPHLGRHGRRPLPRGGLRRLRAHLAYLKAQRLVSPFTNEVFVFATPGAAMADTVSALRSLLDGKLVIDATNNVQGELMNSAGTIGAAAPGACTSDPSTPSGGSCSTSTSSGGSRPTWSSARSCPSPPPRGDQGARPGPRSGPKGRLTGFTLVARSPSIPRSLPFVNARAFGGPTTTAPTSLSSFTAPEDQKWNLSARCGCRYSRAVNALAPASVSGVTFTLPPPETPRARRGLVRVRAALPGAR